MIKKRFDGWLVLIFIARIALYANFMVYAACVPVLLGKWDMSATQAGSISSAFMFGYAASLFVFAWLSDRYGARRLFLFSAVLSALSAMGFGFFAQSYLTGLVLYGLAASTQGGLYTPAIILFSERYDASKRGGAMGYLIASTSIGYAFSLVVSGLCLAWGGYRVAFMVTGCLPVVGMLFCWLALRTTPNRTHAGGRRPGVPAIFRRNRNVGLLIAGYTFHGWELLGMWTWTPAFFAAVIAVSGDGFGETARFGAYLVASMHLVGALASVSMGRLADLLGRRIVLVQVATVGAGLSLVIGWLTFLPAGLLVFIGLVYYFFALGDSPVLSTALTEAVEPNCLGSVLAIRALLGFGAGGIAPIAFGAVLDLTNAPGTTPDTWGWAFMVLGCGGVAAALCASFYRESGKMRRPIRSQ
ncbi:MFS transporter [Desulfosarcina alkanivorans]|jgi:MFS family permease|uniref:MFS transporter n=1 Tax=Desulfosarcina alkanivorans TaxID=571177 RepID=A0A5K7YJI0_9BACT|nr:MFS transporter [Desulfosarcina alkanivorans]BBO66931.1 MFS transporter [Desulfosarcina alkanivorans]